MCRFGQSSGKIEAGTTISVTSFAGIKRESYEDSDEYNLAIKSANLFDVLDLNIKCF